MAKDPAFLFYSSDFLSGISDLTMDERGQYITLLCLQHQKGRLTKKNIGIAVPNATADTMAKFKIDENGLFFNERLEKEINKRLEFTQKQKQRAIDGWKKRKANLDATANATALPLENENENEDINKDIIIDKKENKNLIFSNKLKNDPQWIEDLCRKNKTTNLKILEYIDIFNLKLSTEFDVKIDKKEYAQHFSNWFNIELKKEKKDQLNGKEKLTGAQAFIRQFENLK